MDEMRNGMRESLKEFEVLEMAAAVSQDGIIMSLMTFATDDGTIGYSMSITPGPGCTNSEKIVDMFNLVANEHQMVPLPGEVLEAVKDVQNDLLIG